MVESSNRFRNFAARLLEYEGALVERIEPEGLEAMLPAKIQEQLRTPEFLRLGFAAELPENTQRVSLESDWLDKFGQLISRRGERCKFVANVELPPLSYSRRAVEHGVVLQNAVYRHSKVEPAWTRYLILLFRYTAISDEKREGVIKLGFNLLNGSAIDAFIDVLLVAALDAHLPEAVTKPEANQLPEVWSAARLKKIVTRSVHHRVSAQLDQFLNGMQRRLDRDLERLHEYFTGLREESLRKLKKQKGDSARERLRLESTAREYQAKVADLKQKYDLRINVEFSQLLEFICPVHRVTLVVKRRKGERELSLDWNPLSRMLDPLPCEWSFVAEGKRVVCDDSLHIISPEGHAPCVQCGKEYCRVCSPRHCPKCGRVDE